jgi:hypothetical protein
MVRAILESRKTQTRRVVRNPARLDGLMLSGEESAWCPYGQPGDRLWVRETTWRNGGYVATDKSNIAHEGKCPSIFMPRWVSRINLKLTDVRVERLQDISEADAIAEGIQGDGIMYYDYSPEGTGLPTQTPRSSYCGLWDSINGKRFPWASNPWVWVLTFRRIR